MSKGFDIVALLEWAERQRTFKQTKTKGSRRPKIDKDFDPIDYIRKEEERLDRWKKFLKDKEKLDKKDEEKPKDPKKSFSFLEWYVIGALSYPLLGPLYKHLVGG